MISSELQQLILSAEDTTFIIIVGVVAAVIVVALFVTVFRRTITLSGDLSKEYKAKLATLKLAPTSDDYRPSEQPQFKPRLDLSHNASNLATLKPKSDDTERELRYFVQENAQLRANETVRLHEIENLRKELEALRETIATERQDFEHFRTTTDREKAALQEQIQSIEVQWRELQEEKEKLAKELAAQKQDSSDLRVSVEKERILIQSQILELEKKRRELEEAKEGLEKELLQLRAERELSRTERELIQTKACPSCGRELQSADRFCDRCGFRFQM